MDHLLAALGGLARLEADTLSWAPAHRVRRGDVPKVEQAITHSVDKADWHAGMLRRLPPTSAPCGTCTFPPRMMADTVRFRRVGDRPICERRSLISMEAPWECPMKMTGAPPIVVVGQVVVHADRPRAAMRVGVPTGARSGRPGRWGTRAVWARVAQRIVSTTERTGDAGRPQPAASAPPGFTRQELERGRTGS
jgi:hypothetical protein